MMMSTDIAKKMFGPHAFATGWYEPCLRFPAIGAVSTTRQKYCTIQLDAGEASLAADRRHRFTLFLMMNKRMGTRDFLIVIGSVFEIGLQI